MTTVRQIQRQWDARKYQELYRDPITSRPESAARIEGDGSPAMVAAAIAVIRLDELSQSHVPLCGTLVRTLIGCQHADGGWRDPMVTALVLRALIASKGAGHAIDRGMAYLATLQKDDGAWPREPIRRLTADALATAFVLYELGDDSRFRQAVHFDRAVQWLAQHESSLDDSARRLWQRIRIRSRLVTTSRATDPSQAVFAWS